MSILDHTPNVAYQTRGGARLIYLIEPTHDPEWFESQYAAFMPKLDEPFSNVKCGYQLDTAVKDWSRLFRSARVTRDGVEEFDHQIRFFHDRLLNLNTFRLKRKPARKAKAQGRKPFRSRDPKLLRLIRTKLVPGNRNNALFQGLCHVYRTYDPEGATRWIESIREAAANSGIDGAEFEAVLRSAQKQGDK